MTTGIRLVAECYDIDTGKTIEKEVLRDDNLSKATTLKELGYLHVEQIDFLKKYKTLKSNTK